jgi:hypothetical protein
MGPSGSRFAGTVAVLSLSVTLAVSVTGPVSQVSTQGGSSVERLQLIQQLFRDGLLSPVQRVRDGAALYAQSHCNTTQNQWGNSCK